MRKQKRRIAGREIDPPLSDRERILMAIIDRLSSTQILRGPRGAWTSEYYADPSGGSPYVHFAPWKKPEPGDLVLAKTGGVSRWKVGFYVEALPGAGGAVIREIGSDKLCNYGNEGFEPIVGMDALTLLEGENRRLYVKVMQAFRRGDEYCYRFGGFRIEGTEAVVTVREVFGGLGAPSVPFEVRFRWTKKTSVAAILRAMRQQGYGTKDFRPQLPPAPQEATT